MQRTPNRGLKCQFFLQSLDPQAKIWATPSLGFQLYLNLKSLLISVPVSRCRFRIPGWARISGRDYFLSELEKMTWFEAEAKALENDAYLAEIESEEENKIFEEIKDCNNYFN